MENELPEATLAQITESIIAGRKIDAIKTYRELTHLGLKESKDAIERLEVELRAKHPERFANRPAAKGCLVGFVLLGAFALTAGGAALTLALA